MTNILSYEEIRRVQNIERDNKSLQNIEDSFFERLKDYIKTKKESIRENQGKKNIFSKQMAEKNEYELKNVMSIIEDIKSRRRRKVIFQALNNVTARVHNTENMLPEEEKLYNNTIEIIKEYNNTFTSRLEEKQEIKKAEKKDDGIKKVKVLDKIPQFVWKDGKIYGPFEEGMKINIPKEIGEILINEGKAIEITLSD